VARVLTSFGLCLVASLAFAGDQTEFDLRPLPVTPEARPSWTASLGKMTPHFDRATIAVAEHKVVVVCGHQIFGLNAESGKQLWQRDLGATLRAIFPSFEPTDDTYRNLRPIAITQQEIYCSTSNEKHNFVFTLAARTGRLVDAAEFNTIGSPYVSPDGTVGCLGQGQLLFFSRNGHYRIFQNPQPSDWLRLFPSLRGRLVSLGSFALANGVGMGATGDLGDTLAAKVAGDFIYGVHANDDWMDTDESVRGRIGISRVEVEGLSSDTPHETADLWQKRLAPFAYGLPHFNNVVAVVGSECYAIYDKPGIAKQCLVRFEIDHPTMEPEELVWFMPAPFPFGAIRDPHCLLDHTFLLQDDRDLHAYDLRTWSNRLLCKNVFDWAPSGDGVYYLSRDIDDANGQWTVSFTPLDEQR